jgi:MOSC domain-containing protein YiiM
VRVIEVSAGPAAVIGEKRGRPWRSAIVKAPVGGRVAVGPLGLEGDEQHNRKYHGGPHQAVYAYAAEDVAWWAAELGRTMDSGVLGQNLTTEGADVNAVVVGERWRVGSTLLEATSPRIPCATLAHRVGAPGMVRRFARAGRCGAYFRVLEPGTVGAGDPIEVVARPADSLTVADVMTILLFDHERAGELLALEALNPVGTAWAARRQEPASVAPRSPPPAERSPGGSAD